MKRLLVVADDLGLTPGINRGIVAGFRDGIVTSSSFLTNTAHFQETLETLRSLKGLKVGIHLSLVGGRPVLDPGSVRSLTIRDGRFHLSWRSFLCAYLARRVRGEEVRSEWRSQISRAVDAGIRPTHLDSHQHLHILPPLWRIATGLAREFAIPRIRILREPGRQPRGVPLFRRLVRFTLSRLSPRPRPEDPPTSCDQFLGLAETGHLKLPSLLDLLRRVPEGWSELITHPGIPDPELRRDYRWGYEWEEELRALCSNEARAELGPLRIALDRE